MMTRLKLRSVISRIGEAGATGQVRGKVLSLLLVDLNVRSGDCMRVERSRRF